MRRIASAALALAFVALAMPPALAAPRCYGPDEMAAENLLRLHSELMVITVTCKQGSTGRDLGRAYTGITRQHIKAIQEAESTMKAYYASVYGGDGLARLDTLRTRMANDFGQEVASESAPAFCAGRRDLVTRVYDSKSFSFAQESQKAFAGARGYEPLCEKGARVAAIRKGEDKK